MPDQFTPPASGPAAASTDALFGGLLPLEWKTFQFPFTHFRTRVRQDLAIHKFADRDGAHFEGTGRAPLEFSCRIPFLNGLDAGPQETWSRPLYPFVRDNVLRAAVDRSSGILQHPELGNITCKLQTMEWELEAQVRSGVWADISWIETDDTGIDLQQDLTNPSPLANAQAAANDLTFQLHEIDPSIVPQPYVPPVGFDDLMIAIRGVVDTPTLLQYETAGRVNSLIYQATAMQASLNSKANRSALNWPMIDACERAKEAGYDLKATLLSKGKGIKLFTVQKPSTMAQVAAMIGAPVNDIVQLNPAFVRGPIISAGSVVRFYAKNAA
jgi:hypothetical protein